MYDEPTAPTDTHFFVAVIDDDVYEDVRLTLDEAFNHPKNGTLTCVEPAASQRHDSQGRPLVAILNEQAAWPEVADALEQLEAAELIEYITREDWDAASPVEPEQ